jgi:hypothetical protein
MKFSEFKNVVRSGDLIALSHQSWASEKDIESQIVRMATRSEFSHVCVALVEDEDVYCIEAIVPHVSITRLEERLSEGFYHIPTPDKPMTEEEKQYGLSKVGDGYSKLEAIEGYLDLLKIGYDGLWQCSELTIAMRRLSGLDLGPIATPAKVVEKAMKLGYEMRFITKD